MENLIHQLTEKFLLKMRNIAKSNDFYIIKAKTYEKCLKVHYRDFLSNKWVKEVISFDQSMAPVFVIGENSDSVWETYDDLNISHVFLIKLNFFANTLECINMDDDIQNAEMPLENLKLIMNQNSHAPVERSSVLFPYSQPFELQALNTEHYLHIRIDKNDSIPVWEKWFSLISPKKRQSTFTISATPNMGDNNFGLTTENNLEIKEVSLAAPVKKGPKKLDMHLYVIFDRTTPDKDNWVYARESLRDIVDPKNQTSSPDHDFMDKGSKAGSKDKSIDPSSFNFSFRTTVVSALKKTISTLGLSGKITFCWFADTTKEGWCYHYNNCPLPPFGTIGEFNMTEWDQNVLSNCSYLSGMDVFDPVDDCLNMILNDIDDRCIDNPCIVIAGNSLPTLPLENDPLHEIIYKSSDNHLQQSQPLCDVRDMSINWHQSLKQCHAKQIPLTYLFYRMVNPPIPENFQDSKIDRFNDFESNIIELLKKSIEQKACSFGELKTTDIDTFSQNMKESFQWMLTLLNKKTDQLWVKLK